MHVHLSNPSVFHPCHNLLRPVVGSIMLASPLPPCMCIWISFILMRTSACDHIVSGCYTCACPVHGSGDVSSSRDTAAPPTTLSQCDWLAFSSSPRPSLQSEPRPLLSSSPPPAVINHSVNQIGSSDIFQTPIGTRLPSSASGGLRTDLLQPLVFLKWSWLHMCRVRKLF